jgi:NADPH2:quinone reductase
MMSTTVPTSGTQLRTLVTGQASLEVFLEQAPVPAPGPDQVLLRVEAAPINPSDLGLLFGGADLADAVASGPPSRPVLTAQLPPAALRTLAARVGEPLTAGNEGAGTVIAAGSSPAARELLGRTVAVAPGGMYAQYRLVAAAECLVLPPGVSAQQGASSFINPMTVLAIVETMRREGHTGLVHTAAASSLGQMLNRVCAEQNVPLVNIVRKPEQAQILRAMGAQHVLDSTSPTFAGDLTRALAATLATLAFDAVGGGDLAGQILASMEAAASPGAYSPYGSAVHKQVYIYGGLDRGPTVLRRNYGMSWGVGGWLLGRFLDAAGPDRVGELRATVAAGLTTTFASAYTREVSLAEALRPESYMAYSRKATGEKYLITPHKP